MSIKIKRKSKRFAETIEDFNLSSREKISPINSGLISLKENCLKIVGNAGRENSHLKNMLESVKSLEASLTEFDQHLEHGFGKLIRDYNWLKNKLSMLEDERKNFKLLYELSSALENESELEVLLQVVIESMTRLIEADYGIIEIIDEERNVRLAKDAKARGNITPLLNLKDKVLDAAIDSNSYVIMNSLILKNKINGDRGKLGSVLCLPLKSEQLVIGTMFFGSYSRNFSADETDLFDVLGGRVAAAIENNIRYTELVETRQKLLADLRQKFDFGEVIGNSPQITSVLSTVADIADSDTAVLINGESGTGKEIIAGAIHKNSPRRSESFIPINCSAIPETLLESELFGYEKGAFTGAINRKPGKFEQAHGGTILLDEIGELPTTLQVKLLRFLQSHEFEPLGSNKTVKSDVRIITATKRDLSVMVKDGLFRDDLYYRINVINILIPPIRERPGDIQPLVQHFIKKYSEKNNKEIEGITKEASGLLEQFKFPGNVRELENVIERAVVLCKGKVLSIDDLPSTITCPTGLEGDFAPSSADQLKQVKRRLMNNSVEPVEKNFIIQTLRKTGGNISEAARRTRMHRKQFQRLMKRYNLKTQDVLT